MQSFFLKIKSEGYILSESVDQLLCESCDKFLADRFVEGTCPRCKYEDARGDQCDGCGHLVNATDLISPRCKVCGNRPIVKKSQQFFLDLPKVRIFFAMSVIFISVSYFNREYHFAVRKQVKTMVLESRKRMVKCCKSGCKTVAT